MCTFRLWGRKKLTSGRVVKAKRSHNHPKSVVDVGIAGLVQSWVNAGQLRELSLQHVRDTLTPLEVSIVVAGARPNSLIQQQQHGDSDISASMFTNILYTPAQQDGLGMMYKRTTIRNPEHIVSVTASQRSDIQRMNPTTTPDTPSDSRSATMVPDERDGSIEPVSHMHADEDSRLGDEYG
jgi:hypothetical protein